MGQPRPCPTPGMGSPTGLPAIEDSSGAHRSFHWQRPRTQTRPPRSLSKLMGAPSQAFPSLQGASCLAWVCPRGGGGDSPFWMGVSPGAATAPPPPLGPSRRRAPPEDSRVSSPARLLRAAGLRPPRGVGARPLRAVWGGRGGSAARLGRGRGPPNARPARRSGPARPRPGPASPGASRAGVERRSDPAPRPAPGHPHLPPTHRARAPGRLSRRRTPGPGRACAPRATQSDGPGAARRRRVGTGSAAAGPRPARAHGGPLPVTRGRARLPEGACVEGKETPLVRGRALRVPDPGPTSGDPGAPLLGTPGSSARTQDLHSSPGNPSAPFSDLRSRLQPGHPAPPAGTRHPKTPTLPLRTPELPALTRNPDSTPGHPPPALRPRSSFEDPGAPHPETVAPTPGHPKSVLPLDSPHEIPWL